MLVKTYLDQEGESVLDIISNILVHRHALELIHQLYDTQQCFLTACSVLKCATPEERVQLPIRDCRVLPGK